MNIFKSVRIKYLVLYFLAVILIATVYWQLSKAIEGENETVKESMYTVLLEKDRNILDNSIIYLGDSLTQNYPNPEGTYNLGIGGDTTTGLVNRLRQYQSVKSAKLVYLTIGTNDALRHDLKTFENNLPQLIELIPGKLIWRSIPPVDSKIEKPRKNEEIRLMNDKIRQICSRKSNCEYVNLTDNFVDSMGDLKQEYHNGDGLHLSPLGYSIWNN